MVIFSFTTFYVTVESKARINFIYYACLRKLLYIEMKIKYWAKQLKLLFRVTFTESFKLPKFPTNRMLLCRRIKFPSWPIFLSGWPSFLVRSTKKWWGRGIQIFGQLYQNFGWGYQILSQPNQSLFGCFKSYKRLKAPKNILWV